jgi:hypothetical protein
MPTDRRFDWTFGGRGGVVGVVVEVRVAEEGEEK